jgi:molybdate transport system substrate-binding protein
VLLAADGERPRLLEEGGQAVAGTRFVYALGRLVVFAPGRDDDWTVPEVLTEPGVRVAWAEPRTAPYGAAAQAVLERWGLDGLEGAVGESVGQTLQFALSGAVDVAFVGRAQVMDAPPAEVRELPVDLAPPIPQEAVLLKAGADVRAATDFLAFLRSAEGRARIRAAGYDLPAEGTDGT